MPLEKYISFKLCEEEYGLPILDVQEIINAVKPTSLPGMPEYSMGVINLRDRVIPVIDLKKRLLIRSNGNGTDGGKVIIISKGRANYGVVVDRITGAIDLKTEDIDDTPASVKDIREESRNYISGVAKLDKGRLIQILDPSSLVPVSDLSIFEDELFVESRDEEGNALLSRKVMSMGGEYIVSEVRERIVDGLSEKGGGIEEINMMMDMIQGFLEAVSRGDMDKAEGLIQEMTFLESRELFSEVGKITRNLHNALADFKSIIDPKLKSMALEDMPELSDRLNWVISKTEDAADKTISIMEKNITSQSDLIKRLDILDSAFKDENKHKKEKEALKFLRDAIEDMNTDCMEVIVAQEFQDITGQIIKKVITLVSDLERELVGLIRVFGVKIEPESHRGLKEGAQLNGQEDVDALLKEFGF